jgi:hypothetical protein
MHDGALPSNIAEEAALPDGPFGTHLRSLQAMVEQSSNAKRALLKHLGGEDLTDFEATELLELGILRRLGGKLVFCCKAYEGFFSASGQQ